MSTELKTARQRVEELYERKRREEGLIDVKFDLNVEALRANYPDREAAVEAVCEEILRMEAAMEAGHYTVLNFNDSHRKEL